MSARYSILPALAALDLDLNDSDLRTLVVLGTFLDRNNECWPSQKTLADKTGLHRATVNKCLKHLADKGYIVKQPLAKSGMKTSLRYRVIMEPELINGSAEKPLNSDVVLNDNDIALNDIDVAPRDDIDVASRDDTNIPIEHPQYSVSDDTGKIADLFPESKKTESAPNPDGEFKSIVFGQGLKLLTSQGMKEGAARGVLGKLVKQSDAETVAKIVLDAIKHQPGDAKSWLMAAVNARAGGKAKDALTLTDETAEKVKHLQRWANGSRWKPSWGPDPRVSPKEYPDEIWIAAGVTRPN